MGVTLAKSNQFIRHIQRGYDRDAIQTDHFSAVANLAHLGVQELRRIEEVGALLDGTGNVILLLEYAHAHSRLVVAHACSIDFSRPIIASTRARTCSFF